MYVSPFFIIYGLVCFANHQFVSSWLHIIGISTLLFRLKKKDSEEEKEGNEEEKDSWDLLDSRDLRCFICGDAGHVRREWLEVKMAHQRNSSVSGKKGLKNCKS